MKLTTFIEQLQKVVTENPRIDVRVFDRNDNDQAPEFSIRQDNKSLIIHENMTERAPREKQWTEILFPWNLLEDRRAEASHFANCLMRSQFFFSVNKDFGMGIKFYIGGVKAATLAQVLRVDLAAMHAQTRDVY